MIVLIKDDNGVVWNITELFCRDDMSLKKLELTCKFSQLLYQMFFGRDDDDFLTGITILEDSGNPTDNRCLTSTW